MLGLSLSLSLSSRAAAGGAPSPTITSSNGTTQGAVLTVSSGATLYRDGIAKTAPYTTTANDALATFWAQVGSTRSSSITIDSNAAAPVAYNGIEVRITKRADGGGTAGDFLGVAEWRTRASDGTVLSGTDTTSNSFFGGTTIGLLQDGDLYTGAVFSPAATVTVRRMFASPQILDNAYIDFSPDGFNTNRAPGDFTVYGVVGTTPTASPIATVTGASGYSVATFKTFRVPAPGPTISGTFSYSTALITLAIANLSGTGAVRVLDYTDTSYPIELADWATKADGGTITATLQADYRLLLQDSAAPSEVVASVATVAVMGQSAPNNTLGLNFNLVSPYYGGDEFRNLADRGRWFWSTGPFDNTVGAEVFFNDAGLPIGPVPSGMQTLVCFPYEACHNIGRQGAHTATLLNGAGTFSWHSTVNFTAGTITSTTAAYTIPSSGNVQAYLMIDNPTMPADGLKLLITKDGDGLTYPDDALSPQAARDYEATQFGPRGLWLRDLHISKVENPNNPPSDFGYMCRPEFAARACNQSGANWWHSSHWGESAATRLDYVQRWKATASPTALLAFEYCNEPWNNVYGPQQEGIITAGINAGFMPDYQPPVGVTVYDGVSWTDPATGILLQNVTAGTVFWCFTYNGSAGYCWTLTKCLTGATTGQTVLNSGTNSQWQTLVANSSSGFFTAAYRYQASVQKTIGAMGRAELGSRFKSVLGATQNVSLESVATLTDALMFDNNYEYIDYYAMDSYAAPGLGYNTTTYPWMTDPTDLVTFKNGFFAEVGSLISAMKTQLLNRVDTQFASFIAAGMPAKYAPRPVIYEMGMPRITSVPSGVQANFKTALDATFADSRMQTMISGWMTDLFVKFDILVWHCTVQDIVGASEIQIYGALLDQLEITPPQTRADYPNAARVYLGLLDAAPAV